MTAMQCIRANMKRLRVRQGLTQQSLAEKAGLDYNYLQKIESGRWGGLRVSTVETLALALEVEIWELFVPGTPGKSKTIGRPKVKQSAHAVK
jgi:transcriptional regulator with XRE-family HTH domain